MSQFTCFTVSKCKCWHLRSACFTRTNACFTSTKVQIPRLQEPAPRLWMRGAVSLGPLILVKQVNYS
jgi:hypothetical protein